MVRAGVLIACGLAIIGGVWLVGRTGGDRPALHDGVWVAVVEPIDVGPPWQREETSRVRVLNLATGEELLRTRPGLWGSVEFSPDGRYLQASLRTAYEMTGRSRPFNLFEDQRCLAVATGELTARERRPQPPECFSPVLRDYVFDLHAHSAVQFITWLSGQFSPDSSRLAFDDGLTVAIYEPDGGRTGSLRLQHDPAAWPAGTIRTTAGQGFPVATSNLVWAPNSLHFAADELGGFVIADRDGRVVHRVAWHDVPDDVRAPYIAGWAGTDQLVLTWPDSTPWTFDLTTGAEAWTPPLNPNPPLASSDPVEARIRDLVPGAYDIYVHGRTADGSAVVWRAWAGERREDGSQVIRYLLQRSGELTILNPDLDLRGPAAFVIIGGK